MDKVASKYIQHNYIKYFVDKFIRPRIEFQINSVIPENELKQALIDVFYEIRPLVEDYEMSLQIKESKKLNSPEMTKKLMQLPNFKDIMELIPDGM